MSILSNILGALLAPPSPVVYIDGDITGTETNNDYTGTKNNDNVKFDATVNQGETFNKTTGDYSCLDGGAGIDTLCIKLTHSQYAAFQAEVCAKLGGLKAGGIDFGDICNIFKIMTGQTAIKFDSIGVELKGWECVKFECVADNKGPVAKADCFKVLEDGSICGNVGANDTDDGQGTLTFSLKDPAHVPAGLVFNPAGKPSGSFTFDASAQAYQHLAEGQQTSVTVEYLVSDGLGGVACSSLTIKICGTNDCPTAEAFVNSGKECGDPIKGQVVGHDVDDGAVLHYALQGTVPVGLTFDTVTGKYSFDPTNPAYSSLAEGQTLDVVFHYAVIDEHGASACSTLTITLTGCADKEPMCDCCCTPVNLLAENGSFDHPVVDVQDWSIVNVAGWTNTGLNSDGTIEVWNQAGLNARTLGLVADGKFVIETDGYGNGNGPLVKDVIQTTVNAEAGQLLELSFNYASRNETAAAGNTTDSFEVWWNGTKVGEYDPSSSASWATANLSLVGSASGTNILQIKEAGAEDSFGALIDKVQLMTVCETDGDLVAQWTFENHTQANGDEVGIPTGFWDLSNWAATHPGVYGADADMYGFAGYTQVHGADGHRALDTAASPGNIFLQAIPEGRGGAAATMPDLVDGKEYHAQVKILKQDYHTDPDLVAAGHDGTDPDAWVEFNFNGTVLKVHAADIDPVNEFVTFDITFKGIAGEDGFTIQSHGTQDDPQGLLIDSIQIHEVVKECKPLFTENFDEARVTTFQSNGIDVSADINLAAVGWTGESGHGIGNGAGTEVGISGKLSSLISTTGTQYLDTQNTPGDINISHKFNDCTPASQLGGKTAVLSFDIGKMAVNWNGTDFATDPTATFDFKVDGHTVAHFTAAQFATANVMQHFDVAINESDYVGTGDHTLSLVDTTDPTHTNYFGFAVDSIVITDYAA